MTLNVPVMGGSHCWQPVACGLASVFYRHLGAYPLGCHPSVPPLIQCPVITVHAMDKRVSPRIVAQAIIFLSGEINTDFLLKNIIRSEYIEKISVWVYKDYYCICICYHSLLWLEDYQLYIPWHYTVERKFSHIIFSCILFIIKTSVSQRSCWKQIQFLYNFYVLFGSHWK